MYTKKQLKKLQGYAGKSIANMMVGNESAMIDFLLMIEPTLDRSVLEQAAKGGTLWKHEFDGATKIYEDSEPQASDSSDDHSRREEDRPC